MQLINGISCRHGARSRITPCCGNCWLLNCGCNLFFDCTPIIKSCYTLPNSLARSWCSRCGTQTVRPVGYFLPCMELHANLELWQKLQLYRPTEIMAVQGMMDLPNPARAAGEEASRQLQILVGKHLFKGDKRL